MKTRLLLLLTALQFYGLAYAQEEIDPMRFFPTAVGNLWEYTDPFFPAYQLFITKDSVTEIGDHLVYYNSSYPMYRIDTNYYVYRLSPFWRYYKLDADSGDTWMVFPEDSSVHRLEARVRIIYDAYVLGKETIIKEIDYFELREGDTVITEDSWLIFREILAMDIGEVMYIDAESGPERTLRGCIVNGDTLGTILISVKDDKDLHNKLDYHLSQNYPNPFNPSTRIDYYLPKAGYIKLSIYNMLGEEIAVLEEGYKTSGYHASEFNGSNLASGVYIYRLTADEITLTKKALLLK